MIAVHCETFFGQIDVGFSDLYGGGFVALIKLASLKLQLACAELIHF